MAYNRSMLDTSMNLHDMIYFVPQDSDMLSLDLSVQAYIKVFTTSQKEEDNTEFIRFLHNQNIADELFESEKTTFYTFSSPDKTRFITMFELFSKVSYFEISDHLYEILKEYNHNSDVIIDFFTHDSHSYRLSDLGGEIKLNQLN